jgi:hypothetical protein
MISRRARWKRFNALNPDGPMILCFPEGAWEEVIADDDLACEGEIARAWERSLRMRLYTAEVLQDDQPLDPTFDISWVVARGDYGVPIRQTHGENRGSYLYEPPLKCLSDDIERLHYRELTVDRGTTERRLDMAHEVFDDLLTVRIRGGHWWTLGLTWEVIKLIGLQGLMMAPYDQPENLHRLMSWLRDEHLHFITWFEREGLLSDQNEADYVGSGGIGYSDQLPQPDRQPDEPARLMDLWGFAESQETVGVSPEMFAEFIFPYQLPLLEKFGLNCYGCCEPINDRWDTIKRIPRLRRVSVSPWAKPDRMARQLGRDYIYSRKLNPAPLCVAFNEEVLRRDLRETLDVAGDCVLELIMKDTHTVENEPARLSQWVRIAREEIDRRNRA